MSKPVAQLAISLGLIGSAWSAPEPPWSWKQDDTTLALLHHDQIVWQLNHGPDEPKANFHPLATPGGPTLTAYEPADHPWHRGLWWAWKYLNGVNYWEENRETRRSHGQSTVIETTIETAADFSARATLTIHYHPPGKPALLTEARQLAISPPDAAGAYSIDWTSEFTAGATAVTLDRTPPPSAGGPRHGGYAGLSLRFSTELDGIASLTSDEETSAEQAHSKPARWIAYSTPTASATIFDHPANPRHPQPWYVWNTPHMRFFSPSPIFDETLELAPGGKFRLRYRILIQPAPADADALDHAWKTFASQELPSREPNP